METIVRLLEFNVVVPYFFGTLVGIYFGYKWTLQYAIDMTIESLCEKGFIRHRINDDGEVELLKINGQDD